MTDTSPTLTEAEQTALDRLRAGTHVLVPVEHTGRMEIAFDVAQEQSEFRIPPIEEWWGDLLKAAQEGK